MLTQPTIEKLKEMTLTGMVEAFLEQEGEPDIGQLSFEERFGLLVDAEWLLRHNKRLKRRLREAKLRFPQACIENVEPGASRGLERATIQKLATCNYIANFLNIILAGATGTGKTYVACALAQHACRKGFRATYRRVPRLYEELALARADGTYHKLLAKFARMDVLVLDDFGLAPMKDLDAQGLLDILEDRYGIHSTIITSQLPTKAWHEYIPDPTVADSICDRVVHNAYNIALKGGSRRKSEAKKAKTNNRSK